MRRLPIYFLIDVSESMVGEPIQQVEEGMATIIKALKTDPYAIETVWVSVQVFAGQAKTIVPLQEIINFYPPRFPIGGGTSLSNGLGHLMYELRKNQVKTTHDVKGDWKPIIFLFTDGVPTDDTTKAIEEWNRNWRRQTNLVAVSFGNEADTQVLGQLTEHVLMFNNTDTAAYAEFFKWVTASIKTSSVSVENNQSGFDLDKMPGDALSKIDLSKTDHSNQQHVDSNFVVLAGKCQNTKRPYLMKYRKVVGPSSSFAEIGLSTRAYRMVGAYQVSDEYFALSDTTGPRSFTIHTDELVGAPNCPCCGNQIGFAMCSCGGIHCLGDEEISTCPWCGNQGRYVAGDGGFDVNRTQG